MKKLFINGFNKILILIISALGFSISCNTEHEYGTPTADFILNGITIDEANNPIENIEIKESNITLYSNEDGHFSLHKMPFNGTITVDLSLVDIDDTAHGKFLPLDTVIEFSNLQFEGGDGKWDSGTATEEIELTMKKDTSSNS